MPDRFKAPDSASGRVDYEIGLMTIQDGSELQVAIVGWPEIGQTIAQRTATNLIEDLVPRLMILVGIGGAVPSRDSRLGEVVCATGAHAFCVTAALERRNDKLEVHGRPMDPRIETLVGRRCSRGVELPFEMS